MPEHDLERIAESLRRLARAKPGAYFTVDRVAKMAATTGMKFGHERTRACLRKLVEGQRAERRRSEWKHYLYRPTST